MEHPWLERCAQVCKSFNLHCLVCCQDSARNKTLIIFILNLLFCRNLLDQSNGRVSLFPAPKTGPGPWLTPAHPAVRSLIRMLTEHTRCERHCPRGWGTAEPRASQALALRALQPRGASPPAGSFPSPTISPWGSPETQCLARRPHSRLGTPLACRDFLSTRPWIIHPAPKVWYAEGAPQMLANHWAPTLPLWPPLRQWLAMWTVYNVALLVYPRC